MARRSNSFLFVVVVGDGENASAIEQHILDTIARK
jgi:hypothetical protein